MPAARREPWSSRAAGKRVTTRPLRPARETRRPASWAYRATAEHTPQQRHTERQVRARFLRKRLRKRLRERQRNAGNQVLVNCNKSPGK